LISD